MPMANREEFLSGSECSTANPAAFSSDMICQLVNSPVGSASAATIPVQGQCQWLPSRAVARRGQRSRALSGRAGCAPHGGQAESGLKEIGPGTTCQPLRRDLDFGCLPHCRNGSCNILRPHRQLAMTLLPDRWHCPCSMPLGGSPESAALVRADGRSSPQTDCSYKPSSHRVKHRQRPSGHSGWDERICGE
jgi:hypothetical protein